MYYLIMIIGVLITTMAQGYITSKYNSTKQIMSKKHLSGREVARKILDSNGLSNVKIEEVQGTLTDHYDPRGKVVRLSSDIYNNTSLASVSVASHECGHAIQDKEGYTFLRFRNSIVPVVNLCSKLGYVAIMIGLFASLFKLIWIGVIMELVILLFQVVTLPVEFNASSRALVQIDKLVMVDKDEQKKCRGMLTAAALTYVAAVCTALLEIFRLVMIARGSDRR